MIDPGARAHRPLCHHRAMSEPFDLDHFLQIPRLTGLRASPDGSWLAVSVADARCRGQGLQERHLGPRPDRDQAATPPDALGGRRERGRLPARRLAALHLGAARIPMPSRTRPRTSRRPDSGCCPPRAARRACCWRRRPAWPASPPRARAATSCSPCPSIPGPPTSPPTRPSRRPARTPASARCSSSASRSATGTTTWGRETCACSRRPRRARRRRRWPTRAT